ncbi:MAG: hypothetical protein IJ767_04345 [Bacteroidaceae bacterium]|nr:hypothetical protein [Bacteroidaceae bacterium]
MLMAKKKEEEEPKKESLVTLDDFADNLSDAVAAFVARWRMALSPSERGVEDFDIMRLRHELSLYRTPDGEDLFPHARRLLAEQGYTFRSAFGSEIMFLVRRDRGITMDFDEAEDVTI